MRSDRVSTKSPNWRLYHSQSVLTWARIEAMLPLSMVVSTSTRMYMVPATSVTAFCKTSRQISRSTRNTLTFLAAHVLTASTACVCSAGQLFGSMLV